MKSIKLLMVGLILELANNQYSSKLKPFISTYFYVKAIFKFIENKKKVSKFEI